MKRIISFLSVLIVGISMTACGSGEAASAPSISENDRSLVEQKLGKNGSKTDSKSDSENDGRSDEESDSEGSENGSKILVAYFSRADENYSVGNIDKGNTQIIAEYIAKELQADSFHIETVTPYPAGYDDCCDVAKQEQADNARPEISGKVDNMEQYDIVFLGYPIWWGDLPMAVYTFMESYDFSDKVIIPFNTHEGSGDAGTYSNIAKALPSAQVTDGMSIQGKTAQEFNSDTEQSVHDWLDGLGF